MSMAGLSEQTILDLDKGEPASVRNPHVADPAAVEVFEAVVESIRQLCCCSSRTVFGVPCVLRYLRVTQRRACLCTAFLQCVPAPSLDAGQNDVALLMEYRAGLR